MDATLDWRLHNPSTELRDNDSMTSAATAAWFAQDTDPDLDATVVPMPDAHGREVEVITLKRVDARFELERRLGDGTYAVVQLGRRRDRSNGRSSHVALKRYKETHVPNLGLPESLVREAALLQRLQHEHIVALESVLIADKRIFLVLEYCRHSLETVLDARDSDDPDDYLKRPVLRERELQHVMRGVLAALAFCHGKGVLHRDISPSNVFLLLEHVGDVCAAQVKLGDFNLARMTNDLDRAPLTPGMTTISYRAPELLLQYSREEPSLYGTASDIWSVGCIAAEALRGAPMFDDGSTLGMLAELMTVLGAPSEDMLANWPSNRRASLQKRARKADYAHDGRGFRDRLPEELSAEAEQFLRDILVYEPRQRPSANQLLQSSFLIL